MASGVRLVSTDPALRGRMYLVEHPYRDYLVPKICAQCNVIHTKKTYHLQLDGEGAVIVSDTIYDRLREAGMPKLKVANEVKAPPSQKVGIGGPVLRFSEEPVVQRTKGGRLQAVVNKLLLPREV
jgi:hypothetical protein